MTTTGPLEDGTTSLLVLVLLGGDDKLVIVESGGTVLEGTLVLERPSWVLDDTLPERRGTSVLLGILLDVDESESLELVDVAGGGRALELPLSGVTVQVLSSLTRFAPFTTIGVRVIVQV